MWTLAVELDTLLKVGRWEQLFLSSCLEDGKGLAMASTGPGKATPSDCWGQQDGVGQGTDISGDENPFNLLRPCALTYVTEALKLRLVVLIAIIFIF